jgi:hypothetical protein
MLTLAAALMLLPASAWSDTEISAVTFVKGEIPETATVEADVVPGDPSPTDPIGNADGIIVHDAATTLIDSGALKGASNGNTVNVEGEVTINNGGDKYYTVVGGATVNKAGDSSGNTVNVTATSAPTVVGNNNTGSVVGGVTAHLSDDELNYTVGNATGNHVNLTAGESNAITVNNQVTGGLSTHGNATNNEVRINGATAGVNIGNNVYGGAADSNEAALAEGESHPASSGDASSNTVDIKGTVTIGGTVYGGATYHGNANNNTVTYKGAAGSTVGKADAGTGGITGGGANLGNANENTVTISGSGKIVSVVGGSTTGQHPEGDDSGVKHDANLNTVTIGGTGDAAVAADFTVTHEVTGGNTGHGDASSNKVTITGGTYGVSATAGANIKGGSVTIGDATGNTVTISDAKFVSGSTQATRSHILGGTTSVGAASNNKVSLTRVTTDGASGVYIAGGDLGNNNATTDFTGTVSGNEVSLVDSVITGTHAIVLGGYEWNTNTKGTVNISGNSVTLSGNAYAPTIYGGWIGVSAGDATGNTVSIDTTNATTIKTVTGGSAVKGNANDNAVTLSNKGTFTAVTGGGSSTGNADGNKVTITGAAPETEGTYLLTTTTVTGGSTTATTKGGASNNVVEISNATVTTVTGGQALTATDGSANNNVININNAEITTAITGGYGKTLAQGNTITIEGSKVGAVTGGQTVDGNVIDNHITIRNSTITGEVYAGVTGSEPADKATGNSVTLDNVKIDVSDVSLNGATLTISAARIAAEQATGAATGNTVTLTGEIGLNVGTAKTTPAKIDLKSVSGEATTGDAYTGNTLEVRDYKAATGAASFNEISGFETYDFYFENVPVVGEGAVLTANAVKLDNTAGTKHANVNLTLAGKAATLKQGDEVNLFDATTLTGAADATLTITQGATLQYAGTLGSDGNIDITRVSAKPNSKALAESAIAGLALLTQSGDLVAGRGIAAAARSAQSSGLQGFGAIDGGSLRYDTGSSVDVDGFSLLAGLSYGAGLSAGKLTFGAFFEYGQGDFDTSNSFATGKVKGSGDTEYYGGGLLLRFEQTDTPSGHFYAEGSLRSGKAETEFSSRDLNAKFDTEGSYLGVHLGAGYIWKLTDRANLDVYAKYLWSRQDGDKVTLRSGDPVEFDDADSQRLRIGARFDWQATDRVSPYVGLAYEHEFDGEAKATTYGHEIDAPELKGSTGIGELGVSVKAGKYATVEVGAQGYTGKRDGVTGSLKLKIEF